MKSVEWSEEAILSMQAIYDYIFLESPQNADLVIDALFDLGEKLNIFPEKKFNALRLLLIAESAEC